ncbi:hypothetical protein [Kitasatospora sp. GAS204B]|nr:hypothetical protein [Kitasatospora sp. GAS204B]MDH6117240.1 hypothetical protein [Kitasatospora sp. GAS204B]
MLDSDRLEQLDLPDHETVVEWPEYMPMFFPEVSGDSGSDA